jgi:hypothetical protein
MKFHRHDVYPGAAWENEARLCEFEAGRLDNDHCREAGSSRTEIQAYPVVCIVGSLWRIPEGTGYFYVQKGVGVRANRLSPSAASLL